MISPVYHLSWLIPTNAFNFTSKFDSTNRPGEFGIRSIGCMFARYFVVWGGIYSLYSHREAWKFKLMKITYILASLKYWLCFINHCICNNLGVKCWSKNPLNDGKKIIHLSPYVHPKSERFDSLGSGWLIHYRTVVWMNMFVSSHIKF